MHTVLSFVIPFDCATYSTEIINQFFEVPALHVETSCLSHTRDRSNYKLNQWYYKPWAIF